MDTPTFADLGLPAPLLAAIESLGYEQPSRIQTIAIPPALAGRDLVGISETGSGKTAAFALPLLAKIDPATPATQALILCPTRELANQVCEDVHGFASGIPGLRVLPVYGGAAMDRQLRALRQGVHVVVGTPGRVLDHLHRGSLDPSAIRTVVLDEADRMLDMGFRDDMETLLADMPEERQTLFFSATMNREVRGLIQRFGRSPETLQVEQKARTVATIDQCAYEVRQRSKIEVVSRLLDLDPARLTIIFCNTKRAVDECTEALLARGYPVDRLHGDITQQMRERVLNRFRAGTIEVLVATDVAARGLDIDEIDLVINYDLPQDPEDYIHRIGRTGRAGRSGRAVSFAFGRDLHRLESIERHTRQPIRRERVPSQEQVEGRLADRLFEQLKDRLAAADFPSAEYELDRLLEQGYTPTDVTSALFSMLREVYGREFTPIQEDREEPTARGERGKRKEPREKRPPRDHDANPNMVPLFCSLGKRAGARVGDLIGMLYNEAQLPQGAIGHVRMLDKFSIIEVAPEYAEELIALAPRLTLRGKRFLIDHDRGRPR